MQYALHKYFKLSRVHNVMFGLLEGSLRAPGVLHWTRHWCRQRAKWKRHPNSLFRVRVAVQLEHDACHVREANKSDSRSVRRHLETANQSHDESLHQVPVVEVGRRVSVLVDDAARRIQHKRDVGPRVPARCNSNFRHHATNLAVIRPICQIWNRI